MKIAGYLLFLIVSIVWLGVSNIKSLDFTHSCIPPSFQTDANGGEPNSTTSGTRVPRIVKAEPDRDESGPCGKDGLITGTEVCAPRIIIGGAMKCGTNEIMRLLSLHPRVQFRLCDPSTTDGSECNPKNYQGAVHDGQKQIWEFSPGALMENPSAFANRLAKVDGSANITADKAPGFLMSASPGAVRQLMPNTKFVMTVCDPSERLISHYYHIFRSDRTSEKNKRRIAKFAPNLAYSNFEDFAQILSGTSDACVLHPKECELFQEFFLPRGYYSETIQKWHQFYPKSSFLTLHMEAPSQEKVRRLLEFADLPLDEYPWGAEEGPRKYVNDNDLTKYSGRSQEWDKHPNLMTDLSKIYSETNERLANLIGEDYPLQWGKNRAQIAPQDQTRFVESHDNSKKPIFVLHIGPSKTGTTTLQCFLGQNNHILKRNNFHYIGHFYAPNCGIQDRSRILDHPEDVPRPILMNRCIKCDPKEEECDCEGAWNEFSNIVDAHYQAGHNVIMSDEMFEQQFNQSDMKKMASVLSKWHVRVVYAYRDLYQRVTSQRFQRFNPYRGLARFEKWPDSGGSLIPSVQADFDGKKKKGYLNKTISSTSTWSYVFHDFIIVNMHHETNILSNMLCTMVPEAKEICSYAFNTTDETVHNPSSAKPLHFDKVAVAAREQGILKNNNITRSEVRDRIEDYFAKQGKTLLAHFPLSCLSETDQADWKEDTIKFMEALYPQFGDSQKVGISNVLSTVDARFQTHVAKHKFCSVDTDLVLKEPSLRVRLQE